MERKMEEGDVLSVAQDEAHRFTGIGPALILEISKPCLLSDSFFDNPAIQIGRVHEEQKHLTVHGSEPMRGTSRQDHVAPDAKAHGDPLKRSP
jgi:hypothetical protein